MFTKKQEPEPKPVTTTRTNGSSTFSVLGADTSIKGDISASSDLHVDGRIEGDISCSTFVQGETSEIVGSVAAQSARLAGIVSGSIDVRELVILKTAQIKGDLQYDTLTIEQGAMIEGQLSPRGSQAPVSAVSAGSDEDDAGQEQQEGSLLRLSEAAS